MATFLSAKSLTKTLFQIRLSEADDIHSVGDVNFPADRRVGLHSTASGRPTF